MKRVHLGDVCTVIAGQSPVGSSYNDTGNGIEFHQGKKLFGENELQSSTVYTTQPTKIAEPGDILISVRAPVGPVNYTDRRICIGRGLAAIRAGDKIDRSYLFHFLRMNEASINGRQGATFASINKKDIEAILLPLPSLEEQRRIIARLDATFEKIDRATELTQKNITNSDLLFGGLLDAAINESKDIECKALGDIANIEYGLTAKAKPEGSLRFVRITDIDNDGFLRVNDAMYIDSNSNTAKYSLAHGDLLVARTGATFGKVLYFNNPEPSVFASYLIRINFNKAIHPKLFWYYAKTPQYWGQANVLASGAAQPQFNGNALKKIRFSYPTDLDEQVAIVKKLDKHHQATLKLKNVHLRKLKDLRSLKQFLLAQAFSQGEVK